MITLDESKELIRLGLNSFSSDLYYDKNGKLKIGKSEKPDCTPTWSGEALLDLIPKDTYINEDKEIILEINKEDDTSYFFGYTIYGEESNYEFETWGDDFSRCCYKTIKWLLENKAL